jgi:hypothetical protein
MRKSVRLVGYSHVEFTAVVYECVVSNISHTI